MEDLKLHELVAAAHHHQKSSLAGEPTQASTLLWQEGHHVEQFSRFLGQLRKGLRCFQVEFTTELTPHTQHTSHPPKAATIRVSPCACMRFSTLPPVLRTASAGLAVFFKSCLRGSSQQVAHLTPPEGCNHSGFPLRLHALSHPPTCAKNRSFLHL